MKKEKLLKCFDGMCTFMAIHGFVEMDERAVAIREMIENQAFKEVTEEWIEEKAKKMKNIVISFFAPGSQTRWMADPLERCKDFIRSLVEEIQGRLK